MILFTKANGKKPLRIFIAQITFLNLQEDFVLHLAKELAPLA
jgi:hypothetical protein